EGGGVLARGDVPKLDLPVRAGRGDGIAVGGEGQGVGRTADLIVRLAGLRGGPALARLDVPQLDRSVHAGRGACLPIRTVRDWTRRNALPKSRRQPWRLSRRTSRPRWSPRRARGCCPSATRSQQRGSSRRG